MLQPIDSAVVTSRPVSRQFAEWVSVRNVHPSKAPLLHESSADVHGTFAEARSRWLEGNERVRNLVRQEIISRQLRRHLPPPPAVVLDVGSGEGQQSLRLARAGYEVVAIEPDPTMRDAFDAALAQEPQSVRERVTLRAGALGELELLCDGRRFDVVLLLGVLMYVTSPTTVLGELAARVAPGGILAVAARTTTSAVWRPAARQDWSGAVQALHEFDEAHAAGRDMRYINEIGAPAQAQDLAELIAIPSKQGLALEDWYGVRVAVDVAEEDPLPPQSQDEWESLLAVEERLGSTDPYRQMAQLAHIIWRNPSTLADSYGR